MAKIYRECGREAYDLLHLLIVKYRDDLREADALITLLFVSDLDGGPGLRHHGQTVAGRAQVNGPQDRAEGKADATITLDRAGWEGRSRNARLALLHHELSHFGCTRGKKDPLGRPILHLVPGDWENDGFYEVCRIYGEDAPELKYLRVVEEKLRQRDLPMADPDEAGPDAAQAAPSPDSWRDTPVEDLGLADDLAGALVLNNADTAGKVVRAVASGLIGDFQGVEDDDLAEIRSALDRFWHRLSKAQAESYEAFVAGIAPAPEPTAKAAPKRRRKVAS